MCACVCTYECIAMAHMCRAEDNFQESVSLPSMQIWGLNSGRQTRQQAFLPTEPSTEPLLSQSLIMTKSFKYLLSVRYCFIYEFTELIWEVSTQPEMENKSHCKSTTCLTFQYRPFLQGVSFNRSHMAWSGVKERETLTTLSSPIAGQHGCSTLAFVPNPLSLTLLSEVPRFVLFQLP